MTARALRDYQSRAVNLVLSMWQAGTRRVCLVSPTGSGKTTCGAALVAAHLEAGGTSVVWVAHRRELVTQAAERLRLELDVDVGVICPGVSPSPSASVQVCTIQTLLARSVRPAATLIVLDEAHHYASAAEDFSSFAAEYPTALIAGLTATPARRDGSPLGDVFDDIVVAATYSELIDQGHVAPCVVHTSPPEHPVTGWALDPVEAYKRYAEDSIAVAFFDRVQRAEQWKDNFNLAGIRAAALSDKTPKDERERIIADLNAGNIRVCCNVNVLTEGTDIPPLRTCILARPFSHASPFMQAAGRVLRPHPSKPYAILLDLCDQYAQHGSPTDDRVYSLTGDAITVSRSTGMRSCPACGYPFPYGCPECPRCHWIVPKPPMPEVKIWNVELRRVYRGAETADEHKCAERDRLLGLAERKDWSLGWVVKEYRKLFDADPVLTGLPESARRKEYDRLRRTARERGFKPGFAKIRYKTLFGGWPPRAWDDSAQWVAPETPIHSESSQDADFDSIHESDIEQ